MKLKEFLLGMSIITICIIFWTIVDEPVINTTKEVKIITSETVKAETDKNGEVEVYYENR